MHKKGAPRSVKFILIIVSDTRYREFKSGRVTSDKTSEIVRTILNQTQHKLVGIEYVPDEIELIQKAVLEVIAMQKADVVLLSGGTGITKRDVTVQAIKPILERELQGFSVLFHMLSYNDVGTATMISRAFAGVKAGIVIFGMPGSPNAVRLALKNIILPEISLIVKHAKE